MMEQNENGLCVTGSMLNANATALLEAGRGFLRTASSAKELRIDLSAVEETDSSALGVLFAWLRTAQKSGIDLQIANIPASMVSQARLYGVYETLPLA